MKIVDGVDKEFTIGAGPEQVVLAVDKVVWVARSAKITGVARLDNRIDLVNNRVDIRMRIILY